MATQLVHVLAAPSNYPGVAPTLASPSPVFGLSTGIIQGISAYSNAANPTGLTQVNISYFVSAQKFTGTLIIPEVTATVISSAT